MRVLLTGGSGSVGKAVIERLVQRQFSVLVIGRRSGMAFEGAEYQACDINDYAQLREVVRGCDSIVHLAAVASPGKTTPEDLFRVNCQGTFNVFQAAAEEGIQRVVQASSINAAGQFYGIKPAPLNYLPLDEAHPLFTTDAYSFSKQVVEEIGDYFWRREGISSVAFRLPWVAPAAHHEKIYSARERAQKLASELLSQPPEERRAWFERVWASYNDFRARRPFEQHVPWHEMMRAVPEEDKEGFWAMGSRVNFFTMLDERDSAQAVEKGLTADFSGSHELFVNDSLNWTGVESRTLAELFYPDVPELKADLQGMQSLVSIERARSLIGFEPQYSFGEE